MPDVKLDQSLKNLKQALARLGEAVSEPVRNKLAVDGTIQRFEFAIELFWKVNFLRQENRGFFVQFH